MPIDRLSELPDCLIIHILSFLEVKQAAITAVLSSKWERLKLWTKTPNLVFIEESNIPMTKIDFVMRVNRTLVTCGRNGLETLVIEFPYSQCFSVDVTVWVGFAVKNNVKDVSLLLNKSSRRSSDFYSLPRTMLHNKHLDRLTLCGCIVAPRGTIEWPSLTDLNIKHAELQQHVIDKILSGCPVLSRLVLNRCWGFNRLEVMGSTESKSLCELCVFDPEGEVDEPLLEISAPFLHYLSVVMNAKGRKLRLGNISSLVSATFDFDECDWDRDSEELMNTAKELLEKIRHVEEVELGDGYIKILSRMAISGYKFPRSARTSLLVDTPTEKQSIHGIVGLLESSPNLESLVIGGFVLDDQEHQICPDPKSDLGCDLLQLKTITIKDFVDPNLGGEPMLTLARILLNRAPALEKMVVSSDAMDTCSSGLSSNEQLKISQALLSYPRSSKEAAIFFRN